MLLPGCCTSDVIASRYRISKSYFCVPVDADGNAKLKFQRGYFDTFVSFQRVPDDDYDISLTIGGIPLHLTRERWVFVPQKGVKYDQKYWDGRVGWVDYDSDDETILAFPQAARYCSIYLKAVNRTGKPKLFVRSDGDETRFELPEYSRRKGVLEIPVSVKFLKPFPRDESKIYLTIASNWYNDGRE